jgi:YHS domain-containing protein
MMRRSALAVSLVCAVLAPTASGGDRGAGDEVPPALAPFEHLVGAWKGQGIPRANRLKGWSERHRWAWTFQKGTPAGLSVELEGNRTLARAVLAYVAASKSYRLEGTGPDGKPVSFTGPIDARAQTLTLTRTTPSGPERLTLRLNANRIRYVLLLERKEAGAPQFSRVIETNLGKEGESFAAGGSGENLPKCIVTGGAATLSVVYQGKSYPLCCTGCRDEFNDNPEKYVAKLAARGSASKDAPAPSRARDDGAFDGLIEEKPAPCAEAPAAEDEGWTPLFNGKDLSGWYTFLQEHGKNQDPDRVITIENGAIHLYKHAEDGQKVVMGYIATEKEYGDYHLRLQYRWGEKKFEPRYRLKRDAGLYYHIIGEDAVWPKALQFQIQQTDVGDLIALYGFQLDTWIDPKTRGDDPPRYLGPDQGGEPRVMGGKGLAYQGRLRGDFERDGWNTAEIIVQGGTITHLLNGQVVNQGRNVRFVEADRARPITKGRIALEIEAAELWFRNVEIRSLGDQAGPG